MRQLELQKKRQAERGRGNSAKSGCKQVKIELLQESRDIPTGTGTAEVQAWSAR
jgi:hypothetical protein